MLMILHSVLFSIFFQCISFVRISFLMAGNESCVKTTKHIWFVIGRSEASTKWTLGRGPTGRDWQGIPGADWILNAGFCNAEM